MAPLQCLKSPLGPNGFSNCPKVLWIDQGFSAPSPPHPLAKNALRFWFFECGWRLRRATYITFFLSFISPLFLSPPLLSPQADPSRFLFQNLVIVDC